MARLRKATPEDIAKYVELKQQLTELTNTVKDIGAKAFHAGCAKLFAANPELKSFGWRQYTPGFNDGDPCYFSVDTDYVYINELNQDGEDSDGNYYYGDTAEAEKKEHAGRKRSKWVGWKPDSKAEWKTIFQAVQKFILTFREDEMLAIFGDNVRVNITPKSIKVEDYDCGH